MQEDKSVTLGSETTADADDEQNEIDEDDHPSFIDDERIVEEQDEEEEPMLSTPESSDVEEGSREDNDEETAQEIDEDEEELEEEEDEDEELEGEEDEDEEELGWYGREEDDEEEMEMEGNGCENDGQILENEENTSGDDVLAELLPLPSPIPLNTIEPIMDQNEDMPDVAQPFKGLTREDYAELERVWKESEVYLKEREKEKTAKKKY